MAREEIVSVNLARRLEKLPTSDLNNFQIVFKIQKYIFIGLTHAPLKLAIWRILAVNS